MISSRIRSSLGVLLTSIPLMLSVGGCMSELAPVDSKIVTLATDIVPESNRHFLDGAYVVKQGSDLFGDSVVIRWVGDKAVFYSGTSVLFAETVPSVHSDTARIKGFFRLIRSAETGELDLSALPHEGGGALGRGDATQPMILRGTYSSDRGKIAVGVVLERARPFFDRATPFHVIGHRAGARNSERLGRSENSIEMAIFSEMLGCTGIEIDIKVTKDGQLIVFHDETFSPRTVQSTYILGNVKDFTLAQIRRHATLVYGEKIPTLEEFLVEVRDTTELQLVWLDVKDPEVTEQIIEVQARVNEVKAPDRKHKLEMLFGIASQEALDHFNRAKNKDQIGVICELPADVALTIPTLRVWAPRWTMGLQVQQSRAFQAMGIQVFTWTLDSPDYMRQYLRDGAFDGILTNYPSMLAGLAQ